MTTTDARRIEGGAKALAAAIKLRNSEQRMIYDRFYADLLRLLSSSVLATLAA